MTPTAGPPFTHLVEARSRLDGRKNWPGNRGDAAVLELGEAVAVLAYRVTARREGSTAYAALISSTYHLEDGTWRLGLHQHTPI